MQQVALIDSFSLDPFSLPNDGLATSEVDVGGCEITEALMVAPVVVMLDEGGDLRFKGTRQEVVLQQDAVLQGLVPALDLALRLRMIWRAPHMRHVPILEPCPQIFGDVAWSVVGQQPWAPRQPSAVTAGRFERQVQGAGDVLGLHGRAQLPGDDVP